MAVCFEKIFGFDYYYYSKPPHGNRNQMFFGFSVRVQVFRVDGFGLGFRVNCFVLKAWGSQCKD